MRTLSLIAPRSRNDQPNLQSDRDDKMTGPSLVGTVLARRNKILKTIDVDSFKAHDLALDQTVTVRRALLTSQRDGDAWHQKVQQLASVRDPNFLNVLDLIFDKSSDYVITEPARGHSIADLLRERSRFDLEDVLWLVTALASALDLAAAFSCCPNPISTCWLFTDTRNSFAVNPERRSFSDWPPFLIKLDVWELVRPGKNHTWPFLASKAQSGGSSALAVRQAALLTYELLGGEKESQFKPVNGLGDAGNSILRRGLEGSPLFKSSECFIHKLKSAIPSGDAESRAIPVPASQTREHSGPLPATDDVIRRFNRNTTRLATGVLGVVVFATLVLAVLLQERHSKADDLTKEVKQATGDLLLNAHPAALSNAVGSNGKSTSEINPGQATSVDRGFTPDINHPDVQANANSLSPPHSQDSVRVIRPKIQNARYRSSVRPRFVDVKMRLIALWHQSLARTERSRTWTPFSNLNKGKRKKVVYTAEMSHLIGESSDSIN